MAQVALSRQALGNTAEPSAIVIVRSIRGSPRRRERLNRSRRLDQSRQGSSAIRITPKRANSRPLSREFRVAYPRDALRCRRRPRFPQPRLGGRDHGLEAGIGADVIEVRIDLGEVEETLGRPGEKRT